MKLTKIKISNFKNMVEYEHTFNEKQEIIAAEFGGGKSTIFEAYKWAFGFDVSNYEPTIERNLISGIKTNVTVEFEKDGLDFSVSRISYRSKSTVVNTFDFCGNPVKTLKAFREKIENLFGLDYTTLEILMDIKRFTATDNSKWTWKEQREFLFKLLKIDDSVNTILNKEKYAWIKEQFVKDRQLTEIDILKKLNMDKSTFEKFVDGNMAIIDNNRNKIASYKSVDYESLKKEKAEIESRIEFLSNSSNKAKKTEKVLEKTKELDKLYTKLSAETQRINKEKQDISHKKVELQRLQNEYSVKNSDYISELKKTDKTLEVVNKDIEEINNYVFDESEKVCKYCGATLDEETIKNKIQNFEHEKENRILSLKESEKILIEKKKQLFISLKENKQAYEDIAAELQELNSKIVSEKEVADINAQIENLNSEIKSLKVADVNAEAEKEIAELKERLNVINGDLYHESLIIDLQSENDNLLAQNKEYAVKEQKRLQYEQQVNDFINEKISIVTEVIKEKFNVIGFQFFKYNRTDGEQKNICAVMYNGSDYSQCSVGQKIALNFYLNESLQNIFNTDFPVWVDDIGSAKIFESKHQMIGLLTDNSKKLEYIRIRDKYTLADCENN